MMEPVLAELLSFGTVILLGAMSPGPDWIIVMQHALNGRSQGVCASMGVALGIVAHMGYCLFGVGLLISSTPWLYTLIKVLGGGYLGYLGVRGLRLRALPGREQLAAVSDSGCRKAFRDGLVTNLLNPKVTLFFVSLVSVVVDPSTSTAVLLAYGATAVLVTLVWFSALAWILSIEPLARGLSALQPVIQRVLGIALLGLACYVIFLD